MEFCYESDLNKYEWLSRYFSAGFAGGRGSRFLHELTDKRAKPPLYSAVIVAVVTLPTVCSGLNRISCRDSVCCSSLLRHLQTGWSFLPGNAVNSLICYRLANKLMTHLVPWWRMQYISKYSDYASIVKIHFDSCG